MFSDDYAFSNLLGVDGTGQTYAALRAVDAIQVQTCWEVGRHIVEFEQGGVARAAYGKRLLASLAETLSAEFGLPSLPDF